ncbi:Ferrochelatase, mitochondrial [Eumeta japonica]|uniref:Ferrochelatase, mitochondrial n=1 Tax=Eumeta variegata TaxID=151549 RepID=A0A4C1T0V2_EUMVA|nr:Ferrochelatase, mitochondrial [Eumeta japonica]
MTDRDMIQLPVQSKLGPWIAQSVPRSPKRNIKKLEVQAYIWLCNGEFRILTAWLGSRATLPWLAPATDDAIKVLKKSAAAAPNDHPLFIRALVPSLQIISQEQNVNAKFLMRCPMCVNPRCRDSKKWYRDLCSR